MEKFAVIKRAIRPLVPNSVASWLRRRRQPTNAEIFSAIYRDKSWGAETRDFYSGGGNESEVLAPYISGVRNFLSKRPPMVVVDIGCGDFFVGGQLTDLALSYIACDVVPELIDRNRRMFVRNNLSFMVLDATKDALPPGDIVIVKQVLQHLSNDRIQSVVRNLRRYKTWIICDHTPVTNDFVPNIDIPSGPGVRIHLNSGVVLTEPPFSIRPKSTEILSEIESYHGVVRTLVYTF